MKLARLLPCLPFAAALASAQTASEPAIVQEPMIVEEQLLTESPATVTTVDLSDRPQPELTLPRLAAETANFFQASNDAHGFNDTYALRGLVNTPIFGDPSVSFYLDDLPLGSGFTFPADLTGFARAELRRGPGQNTVFGRAGSAGVITVETPEAAVAGGEVRGSVGNFDARAASVTAHSAAGGAVDVFAAAAYAARDGYVTNTTLGRDIDDKESLSGLARLRFRPTPASELTLLVTALRARDGVQPLVPLGGPFHTVSRSAEGGTDVDAYNAALTAAFATPLGRLTATTSCNDWELGPYSNTLDFGFAELTNASTLVQRNWNEEVKLVSDPKAAVRWLAGAFYSDGYTEGAFVRSFGPSYVYESSRYRIDARDLAAFGEAAFQAGPALAFTAGLRAEHSRKTLGRHNLLAATAFGRAEESGALLPKLGANYALTHGLALFASVGAGYKPGGFSGFTDNRALAAFGPERTKTIEAGLTHQTADQTLATTLRVFYYDIAGYQIERSFATGATTGDDYLVVNAARARSFGGELEAAWKPLAGLSLAAALGATDVTLREFRDPYSGVVYDGRRAPFVPALDASLRADYRHAGGLFAGADLSVTGRTYYTEGEEAAFSQRSYALLGAHLGYATGRWRVTVFGENLTDKEYYSAISAGTGHGTPGAPRTYGFEVTLGF